MCLPHPKTTECESTSSCDSGVVEVCSQRDKSHSDPGGGSADVGLVDEREGVVAFNGRDRR